MVRRSKTKALIPVCIKPANRRELFESPCHHFVRLSFGPTLDELRKGLDGIERGKFGSLWVALNTILMFHLVFFSR